MKLTPHPEKPMIALSIGKLLIFVLSLYNFMMLNLPEGSIVAMSTLISELRDCFLFICIQLAKLVHEDDHANFSSVLYFNKGNT